MLTGAGDAGARIDGKPASKLVGGGGKQAAAAAASMQLALVQQAAKDK